MIQVSIQHFYYTLYRSIMSGLVSFSEQLKVTDSCLFCATPFIEGSMSAFPRLRAKVLWHVIE